MGDVTKLGVVAAFAPVVEPARFRPRMLAELRVNLDQAWLIKNVLPARGWGMLFGASGAGKSFVALDFLAAIAIGAPWNGHRTLAGGCAYLALEGAADAEHRLCALRLARSLEDSAPIAFLKEPLSLARQEEVDALIDALAQEHRAHPLRLIVIDTLARAAAGLDENDAGQMGTVVAAAEELSRAFGALVLVVHHAPWDASRPRGSTALMGAADVVLQVERDGDARSLSVRKLKMGREGQRWDFMLESVDLGCDCDGDPVSSCVVGWPAGERRWPRPKLSASQQLSLRALVKSLETQGEEGVGYVAEPTTTTTLAVWRAAALLENVSSGKTERNRKDAAARIERVLIAKGVVGCRGEVVWLCDPATGCDHGATVAAPKRPTATAPEGRSQRSRAGKT